MNRLTYLESELDKYLKKELVLDIKGNKSIFSSRKEGRYSELHKCWSAVNHSVKPVMSFISNEEVSDGYSVKFIEFPQKFGLSSRSTVPFI